MTSKSQWLESLRQDKALPCVWLLILKWLKLCGLWRSAVFTNYFTAIFGHPAGCNYTADSVPPRSILFYFNLRPYSWDTRGSSSSGKPGVQVSTSAASAVFICLMWFWFVLVSSGWRGQLCLHQWSPVRTGSESISPPTVTTEGKDSVLSTKVVLPFTQL